MKPIKLFLAVGVALLTNQVAAQDFELDPSIQRGRTIYSSNCVSCHMMDGAGIDGLYPSLAGADSLMNDVSGMINWIRNGDEINGVSHSFSLTDREVSDLLNYIRNSWGNEGEAVLPEQIQPALQENEGGN